MSDGDPKIVGKWDELFYLKNVAIHLHMLPTGEVLYWGRREKPVRNTVYSSLNEHKTSVFILNLEKNESRPTKEAPHTIDGMPVNLFCAGHTFLSDGRLIVFGGHVLDGFGEDQCCIYDPWADSFEALPRMVQGRWYPTAITLPDGRALVTSGSSQDVVNPVINLVPQIWNPATGKYNPVMTPNMDIFALWPRLYHSPDGRVFSAGPLAKSRYLDLTKHQGAGEWSSDDDSPARSAGQREYAGSAMYDEGKIIYVSGGGGDNVVPTKAAEIIDLKKRDADWKSTSDITFGRRHHFATTLPDGTVIVTGGTQGLGFNDLSANQPVHTPEIWDPKTGKWTVMAAEEDDRCYHHTALLLPDGRILSSGGGEYDPGNVRKANPPKDTYISAQIFNPPYMFKGEAPTVSNAPKEIKHNEVFTVTIGPNDQIGKVSFTRLGSVTHTHNMNQSFQFLDFTVQGTTVEIKAPKSQALSPAGYYMLFLVSKAGRPAKAPIIRLNPDAPYPILIPEPNFGDGTTLPGNLGLTVQMKQEKIVNEFDRPPVVIGLLPTCPYGLGPCWGGAFEALNEIQDIEAVQPRPDAVNSVAFVYLHKDIIPDFDQWSEQFHNIDSGTYNLRGIEITLSGTVAYHDGDLIFTHTATKTDVLLNQFTASSKLEWDNLAKATRPITQGEANAYPLLDQAVTEPDYAKDKKVEVTGRLNKEQDGKFSLDVRSWK